MMSNSIKKINGYKIYLDAVLGHGTYGIVRLPLPRSTRGNKIVASHNARSRSLTSELVIVV